jgi:hypothetical protein
MPLGLAVVLLVLGVTALVGVIAYVIDKSEEREESKRP